MTPPDDLRRQVLAAVERVRANKPTIEFPPAFTAKPHWPLLGRIWQRSSDDSVDLVLDAILAEFGLNPDGTMKEPPA